VRLGELSPPMVVTLSEQVLEYLDSISGAVGTAYLQTRERLLRRQDRERDRLVQRLLSGDVDAGFRTVAAAAGLELTPPYVVVAVEGAADADRVLGAAWARHGAVVAAGDEGRWVVLLDGDADLVGAVSEGRRLLGGAAVFGVGGVAARLEDVAACARRAQVAVGAGPRLHPGRGMYDFAEVGVLAGLGAVDGAEEFVARLLGPLRDTRHRGLLETLRVHVESSGAAETATRLGVHRHTVAYRLGRVREVTARDPDDPLDRHLLWLALVLVRMGSDAVASPGGPATT